MLTPTVISDYIKFGDVSLYLSDNQYQKERYYKWINESKRTRLIYMSNQVLKWGEPYLVGIAGYEDVALYLYGLIGPWLQEAIYISGTGSGIYIGTPVIPISAPGASGQINIEVGAVGSPIPANTSTYTNNILIGRNIVVVLDSLIVQPSPLPAFDYIFNSLTGTITFNYKLNAGQILTIIYI